MALTHSPKTVIDGLVLYYDMNNTQKSYKGKPVTNFYTNGHLDGGIHVTEAQGGSLSTPLNEIIQMPNPGNSAYVVRSTAVGGVQWTEYELFLSGILQPNTTYCLSCWYAKTADWNGNDTVFHSRWWNADGSEQGTIGGGTGTTIETKTIEGLTWSRVYATFTTGATVNGNHSWYAGYPSQNTAGYRYFTNFQIEAGSYPSPFSNGVRSNTQSILDLAGNHTITANSLTYANDTTSTFSFVKSSSNYISVPNSDLFKTNQFTIEMMLYLTNYGDGDVTTFGVGSGNYAQWYFRTLTSSIQWSAYGTNSPRYHDWQISGSNLTNNFPTNTWLHVCLPVDCESSSSQQIYVNGVAVLNSSVTSTPAVSSWTPADLHIGGFSWDGYTNSKIPVYKFYNRVLSAAEIKQNFDALRGRYGI